MGVQSQLSVIFHQKKSLFVLKQIKSNYICIHVNLAGLSRVTVSGSKGSGHDRTWVSSPFKLLNWIIPLCGELVQGHYVAQRHSVKGMRFRKQRPHWGTTRACLCTHQHKSKYVAHVLPCMYHQQVLHTWQSAHMWHTGKLIHSHPHSCMPHGLTLREGAVKLVINTRYDTLLCFGTVWRGVLQHG